MVPRAISLETHKKWKGQKNAYGPAKSIRVKISYRNNSASAKFCCLQNEWAKIVVCRDKLLTDWVRSGQTGKSLTLGKYTKAVLLCWKHFLIN